jgi:molybdopterin synthase sulfur carrier subunit
VAEVLVRYFAAAAEAAGRDEELLTASTVGELLVDGIVTRDPARALGARVDVLPPFSGG